MSVKPGASSLGLYVVLVFLKLEAQEQGSKTERQIWKSFSSNNVVHCSEA